MTGGDADLARFLLWERSSRDTLEVKRAYVDMAGDLVAGIVLSQIVYWHLPARDGGSRLQVRRDGRLWLAKGRADWWAECRVSPKQADRALALLEERGLVEARLFRFNGSPTKHVRIRPDGFLRAWEACLAGAEGPDGPPADRTGPISPDGENPFAGSGKVHLARPANSLTETPAETTAAAPVAAADEGLVAELVRHGVGRAAARRLARDKPAACRQQLAYLPFAAVRTTPGAWLTNAIRDDYGPPAGYARAACQRKAATPTRSAARPAARRAGSGAELRQEYRRLVREGGDRLAAFARHVEGERAKLARLAEHLSPARRVEQLAGFDRPARRLALFATWWCAGGRFHDRPPQDRGSANSRVPASFRPPTETLRPVENDP